MPVCAVNCSAAFWRAVACDCLKVHIVSDCPDAAGSLVCPPPDEQPAATKVATAAKDRIRAFIDAMSAPWGWDANR
ncbi:hypothetical protein Hesp01_13470 [Herbidospora sp. NBRC 101105]|nr:hypothetical protein Hesp01_13470 [Herbidospora sp. NBRC 101105]